MGQVIKMKIDEVDDANVLGEYWRELTFNEDFSLSKDFVEYFAEDWNSGEAPAVLYDYFEYLNDEKYGDDCPMLAFNNKTGLWVAGYFDDLVFYDEKDDICVVNHEGRKRDTWSFF